LHRTFEYQYGEAISSEFYSFISSPSMYTFGWNVRTLKHAATAFVMDLSQPSKLGTLCVCVCVCVCIMLDALQQHMSSPVFFSQINACNHLSTLDIILYCYKYIIAFVIHIDKRHSAFGKISRHWPKFIIVFITQFSKFSIHFYKKIISNPPTVSIMGYFLN
jgi:hypothetical protein